MTDVVIDAAATNGKPTALEVKGSDASSLIEISTIATERLIVPIVGTMPLIVHNFSEKAKRQMLDAQQGKRSPKANRDPQAEFESAFYRMADGEDGARRYGFPITAFKACTVGAARFYGKDVSMTTLRQCLFMIGKMSPFEAQALVEIKGEPRMREDVVRLGGPSRSADLRFRPEFPEWTTALEIVYVTSSLSRNSVLSLIDAGGLGIGVGEWRPEKRGEFGTFRVDPDREVQILG